MPLLSTSLGHVLLAWLPSAQLDQIVEQFGLTRVAGATLRKELLVTKKNGFSYMVRVDKPQLIAVSVPIFNRQNAVVAALNISSGAMLSKTAAVKNFLPLLEDAKLQIEAGLKVIDVSA
jgi:DNA-binding IclR family transcriptional regulator